MMAAAKTTPKKTKTKKTTKKAAAKSPAELAAEVILKKIGAKPITDHSGSYDAVSTGSALVDDLIGGTMAQDGKPVCPGFPRKRITEVFGAESSGKTTLALHAIAEVQRQGGWAVFLDFEHAIHHGYAKSLGVSFDRKKMLLYQPDFMEQGFEFMFLGIMSGADLVVVDSVAAMVPRSELEKGITDAATIGAQARLMSQNLPKITAWVNNENALKRNPRGASIVFINQVRSAVNTGGGRGSDKTTSGGNALKFYASLRLQSTRIRAESVKKKDKFTGKERTFPFGNHTQIKVVKSKMDSKQGHTTDVFIRYGVGIDEFYSIIEAGVTNNLITKRKGGWFDMDGESFQGRERFRAFLKENPKVFEGLRKKVLRAVQATAEDMLPDEDELDGMGQLSVALDQEFDKNEEPEEVELGEGDFPDDDASEEAESEGDDD